MALPPDYDKTTTPPPAKIPNALPNITQAMLDEATRLSKGTITIPPLPTPATAAAQQQTAAATPSQFDGLDRTSLQALDEKKAKYLQEMLNKITGSTLEVDGKVGAQTLAAAQKAGIIESVNNPAIIETKLEKLEAEYQAKTAKQPAAAPSSSAPTATRWDGLNGKDIDSLSATQAKDLQILLNKGLPKDAQLEVDGKVGAKTFDAALKAGIVSADGKIVENKLKALEAPSPQQPQQSGGLSTLQEKLASANIPNIPDLSFSFANTGTTIPPATPIVATATTSASISPKG